MKTINGRTVKAGETYKHFKGKHYHIITLATHTETNEEMVVYTQIKNGKTYVRPLEMFLSPVDKEKYPEVKQDFRFIRVE